MMDLDPTGGLDLLCGQSVLTGLRWADLPAEESAFRPGHLVGALPVWHAMPVLTGDVRGGPLPCAEAVLEAMRAEQKRLEARLQRFGNSTDAREIWRALGAEAPDTVPELDDKAFAELATRIAESADDAR